jgi:hypothetical protein
LTRPAATHPSRHTLQAGAQAAASDGAPLLLEGGSTPDERQAAFIELALCLAAGLPDAALDPLFVVRAHRCVCCVCVLCVCV